MRTQAFIDTHFTKIPKTIYTVSPAGVIRAFAITSFSYQHPILNCSIGKPSRQNIATLRNYAEGDIDWNGANIMLLFVCDGVPIDVPMRAIHNGRWFFLDREMAGKRANDLTIGNM
jgi:hypothetical protein